MATTDALDAERLRNRFSAGNSSRQGSHQVAKKCTRTVRPLNIVKGTLLPFKSCREKSGFAGPLTGANSAARAAECGHNTNVSAVARNTNLNEPAVGPNCAPRDSGAGR